VCGGWLTPEVFQLLDVDPHEYRAAGLTLQEITGFSTGILHRPLVHTQYASVVSYAIRRCEFDQFLLRRSGASVLEGTPLVSLRRDQDVWIVNDTIRAPVVIGAGGHFCPVAQRLRDRAATPPPVVAKEAEFLIDAGNSTVAPDEPELFFCRDLDGYAWCVRKGNYLNVGIGRRHSADFNRHVADFVSFLEATGKAPGASTRHWRGHAYLASGVGPRPVVADGLLLVGDAAGLAYPESGEGIRPAIESGILAARTLIDAGGRFDREALLGYQAAIAGRHPPSAAAEGPVRTLQAAVGRTLLRSATFTRRVVLDRWFLKRAPAALTH
jgi:flavin-dependent dehydrogenase